MPLNSSQSDALLTIGGTPLHGFEIPEFIKLGGPYRAIVHKQPGGIRQIDSMGPDPHPISWEGIFLAAEAWQRARDLYALYEAGDKIKVAWNDVSGNGAWERDVVITNLALKYKAKNYVEYTIELTEVAVVPEGTVVQDTGGSLNNFLGGANGVPQGALT